MVWVWWVAALIVIGGLAPVWLPLIQGPPKEHKMLAEELDSKAPELVRVWNEHWARAGTAATSWTSFSETGIDIAFMDDWKQSERVTHRGFVFRSYHPTPDTLFSVATGVSPTRENWIELTVSGSGLARTTLYWHGEPVFERSQQLDVDTASVN